MPLPPPPAEWLAALREADFGGRYLMVKCPADLRAAFFAKLGAPGGATVEEVTSIPRARLTRELDDLTVGDPAVPISAIQVGHLMRAVEQASKDLEV